MLGPADISEIAPGLWRWTAGHPEWTPGARPGSTADWPREVGSVAYETEGTLVLIDALVPDGADALWRWLDQRAAECDRVAAVNTIKWHRRSRDAVVARFGADTSRARGRLPRDVEPVPIRGAGETMFWLPRERTLVPGDRLLGGERAGELRLCPESWLGYLGAGLGREGLASALRPLVELPVARVLVSHGSPVLDGGRAAIERALAEAA
jgi:hypothetical protein